MAKRQLNRRQSWRIEKIQEERASRAARRESRAVEELEGGDLGPEQTGLVIAHFGVQVEVEAQEGEHCGQVFRCHLRANLPALVTGVRVVWRPGNQGITPLLLLNKADLIDAQNQGALDALLAVYRTLGYPLMEVSAHDGAGMDSLKARLDGHVSVFVGQSGVGKSSLVNSLLPGVDTRVGALSELTGKGTHTTTTARLFHFPGGGELIDSPGIREFGLGHVSRGDVEAGFIEFQELLGHCRFRDCKHDREPGCALLKALEQGRIQPQRMASYRHIISSLPEAEY